LIISAITQEGKKDQCKMINGQLSIINEKQGFKKQTSIEKPEDIWRNQCKMINGQLSMINGKQEFNK
jgi:hypothetical protein